MHGAAALVQVFVGRVADDARPTHLAYRLRRLVIDLPEPTNQLQARLLRDLVAETALRWRRLESRRRGAVLASRESLLKLLRMFDSGEPARECFYAWGVDFMQRLDPAMRHAEVDAFARLLREDTFKPGGLAAALGPMSPALQRRVERGFQERYGTTMGQYRSVVRALRLAGRLRRNRDKLYSIAMSLHVAPAAVYRILDGATGCTPGEIRLMEDCKYRTLRRTLANALRPLARRSQSLQESQQLSPLGRPKARVRARRK